MKTIHTRIPEGLYEKVQNELENPKSDYTNESEIMREALRDFFEKQKPRRINGALKAFNALIEGGPEAFSKALKEDENGRE